MKTVAIEEHKTGTLISPKVSSAVARAIAENFSPRKIVLFGSYASGHPTPWFGSISKPTPPGESELISLLE
ncbi:MAG: hypothetical protein AB1847_07860 [bacterium]